MPVDLLMYSAARWHLRRRPAARRRRRVPPLAPGDDRGIGFGRCLNDWCSPWGASNITVDSSVRPSLGPATCIAGPVRLDRAFGSIKDEHDYCVGRPSASWSAKSIASPLAQSSAGAKPLRATHLRKHSTFSAQTLGYVRLFVNTQTRDHAPRHEAKSWFEHRRAGPREQCGAAQPRTPDGIRRCTSTMPDMENPRHLNSSRCMPLKMNQNRVGQSAPRRSNATTGGAR